MADKKSDHNFFGQAKYEAGSINNGTSTNLMHSFYGTRFGVHGSEDLGNGMKGIYRLMGNVTGGTSAGVSQTAANFSFNEELWAGVAGNFGTVRFGRSDTAHKLAVLPFRAFTDTIADSQGFNTQRWGRDLGIHYRTKNMNGLVINAQVSPNGNESNANLGLSAVFTTGDLRFSAAVESMGETVTRGRAAVAPTTATLSTGGTATFGGSAPTPNVTNKATTNTAVGVHYKVGALSTGLLYQNTGVNNAKDTVQITLPINYKINDTSTIRAAAVSLETATQKAKTNLAVGYVHSYSRKTNFFVSGWQHTAGGKDVTNFGLGMQRSF
jgi:hypothetical protein